MLWFLGSNFLYLLAVIIRVAQIVSLKKLFHLNFLEISETSFVIDWI